MLIYDNGINSEVESGKKIEFFSIFLIGCYKCIYTPDPVFKLYGCILIDLALLRT